MKKTILLSIFTLFSLVLIMQFVSASIGPDGVEITFSAQNGIYSRDYVYADTYSGYPVYRVYTDGNYPNTQYAPAYYMTYQNYPDYSLSNYYYGNKYNSGYKYYSLSDLKKFAQKQSINNFIDKSAYSRYDINYGKDSQVFCNSADCKDTNPSASNWRYKYTYDPRIDGQGSYENYYYRPSYEPKNGGYNWRY